ncbi:tryptophan dimethylallyltransferase family protein [Amycolatopsis thermophila]|uniref:DMATS type aromatic prenyltransferase n=1 Tax=Amycolatopsis thermophila TaxID=206084 RepID=A0ABU0F021_9PSEU|nr:tryptophan dimethylallyltransferase family protein [Amycolatopsis thermophila]MDQ0380541.1 DMATS type aromatic prenyltransferase [Amycolatopsis thermophila]
MAGFPDDDGDPVVVLRELLDAAGRRPLTRPPLWPSDVADDATPVEFSLALDESGDRAVRILGEPIPENPGPAANIHAAKRFLTHMAQRLDLTLHRFHAVEDLFLAEEPQGKFALWFSVILRPGRPPALKVYFNPLVRGVDAAPALVAEALRRLGLDEAYDTVASSALRRGAADRFSFFALDLDNGPLSRVKLYISHESADSATVERAAEAVDGVNPMALREFLTLAGGGTGPFAGRPLVSSYSFVEAGAGRPGNYSLYLPIRDYVPDDEVARAQVLAHFDRAGLPAAELDRAIGAVTGRALRDGTGLIAHVSLRLGRFGTGTTVYLSSEAYAVTAPRGRMSTAQPRGTATATL